MLKNTDFNENNLIHDECIFVVGFPQKCIKTSGVTSGSREGAHPAREPPNGRGPMMSKTLGFLIYFFARFARD